MNLHENNSIPELPSLILILGKPSNNECAKGVLLDHWPQKLDNSNIVCCKALRPFLLSGFWKVFKATKLFQNAS